MDHHRPLGKEAYIDLTILSASDIKRPWLLPRDEQVAIAWVHPSSKQVTEPAIGCGSTPKWDATLKVPLDLPYDHHDQGKPLPSDLRLTIEIRAKSLLGDALLGTVYIPVNQIAKDDHKDGRVTYQVIRPSGARHGSLSLIARIVNAQKTEVAEAGKKPSSDSNGVPAGQSMPEGIKPNRMSAQPPVSPGNFGQNTFAANGYGVPCAQYGPCQPQGIPSSGIPFQPSIKPGTDYSEQWQPPHRYPDPPHLTTPYMYQTPHQYAENNLLEPYPSYPPVLYPPTYYPYPAGDYVPPSHPPPPSHYPPYYAVGYPSVPTYPPYYP